MKILYIYIPVGNLLSLLSEKNTVNGTSSKKNTYTGTCSTNQISAPTNLCFFLKLDHPQVSPSAPAHHWSIYKMEGIFINLLVKINIRYKYHIST